MMRFSLRLLVLGAVVMFVAARSVDAQVGALRSDPVDSATYAQLAAARDAVWRAWFSADTTALSELLPRALAAGSTGGWTDRESEFASARQFAAGHGRLVDLVFDSTAIRLRGNVAVVQSRYRFELDQQGSRVKRSGIATEIFVREHGRWVNPFWYLE